ncbi:MAG: hypothetical protein J1E39_04660 [Eubacterium sp.]|nr:hypothetical protein [Eubacterium sp.]
MSIKSCAFIGQRKVEYTQHLKDLLQFTLEFLIDDGITEFYSCGEPGGIYFVRQW